MVNSTILSQDVFPDTDTIERILTFLASEGVVPERWQGPEDGPLATHSFPYTREALANKVNSYGKPMSHLNLYLGGDQEICFSPSSDSTLGSTFHIQIDFGDDARSFGFLSRFAFFLNAEYGTATRNGAKAPRPLKYSTSFSAGQYRKTGPTPPGERIWIGPLSLAWLGEGVAHSVFPSRFLNPALLEVDCAPKFLNYTSGENVAHRQDLFDYLQSRATYADYTKVRPLVKRPKGWPPSEKLRAANENAQS